MAWNFEKDPDRIQAAPEEVLRDFLRADAEKTDATRREMDAVLQVLEELSRRRAARGEALDAKAAWEKFCKQHREL